MLIEILKNSLSVQNTFTMWTIDTYSLSMLKIGNNSACSVWDDSTDKISFLSPSGFVSVQTVFSNIVCEK
jgi:hypothetical protein